MLGKRRDAERLPPNDEPGASRRVPWRGQQALDNAQKETLRALLMEDALDEGVLREVDFLLRLVEEKKMTPQRAVYTINTNPTVMVRKMEYAKELKREVDELLGLDDTLLPLE